MAPILFLLFIVVPLLELWIIVQVGDVIGLGWTILLLLTVSLVGAALVKREGTRAWRRFREALEAARLPAREVTDGALVLLGGALMLTPGFATDVVGLLLVLPPSRAVVGRLVRRRVRVSFGVSPPPASRRVRGTRPGHDEEEPIDVEIVSIERNREDGEEPRDGRPG